MRNCFAPLDKALEDIEIIVVGNYSRVMEQLQQFDWKLATCYDPSIMLVPFIKHPCDEHPFML